MSKFGTIPELGYCITMVASALVLFVTLVIPFPGQARTSSEITRNTDRIAAGQPAYCIAVHNIGRIALSVTNQSVFGDGFSGQTGGQDCFTGELVPSLEYPKGSNQKYLFAGCFWIGAVVGPDTLVSVGADGWSSQQEFNPDESPFGDMIFRSTIDPSKPAFEGAVSEQDYICTYLDTCTNCPGGNDLDFLDSRPHRPLNIEVTQASYSWSYAYAEDFVLFDYGIQNIGTERLHDVYMGLYVDAEVHTQALSGPVGWQDDICGFVQSTPATYLPSQCPDTDIVNIAWIADNDGDLLGSIPGGMVPHVTGMRIIRTPTDSLEVSFNWWVSNQDPQLDFGPQARATFRNLTTGGMGTPEGDRAKYHFLSNGEFDYDQIFTAAITPIDETWMTPNPVIKDDIADGYDTRFLLSFGPFDIEPGQTLPLSFAYLAGENLHTVPDNGDNLLSNPAAFYENLDFSDIGLNSTWAEWIYDNPGVDTDNDGYAGVFDTCNLGDDSSLIRIDTLIENSDTIIDTIWRYDNFTVIARRGDGVPDFRGASPPPSPTIRIEPQISAITIRWNGTLSETTKDNFSNEEDFEGYRVYLARDDRRTSYSVLQSFDFENYNKWLWDDSEIVRGSPGAYVLRESPRTLRELRCHYAPEGCDDSLWHPLDWPRNRPFVFHSAVGDSVFYFEPQDFNRSVLANYTGNTSYIRKRFPLAQRPDPNWIDDISLIPDSLRDEVLTDDGLFMFYEYEYTVENLLPTVPYWINVTAFDHGSPLSGLPSLETSPTTMPIVTYALESSESATADDKLRVFVYPNPYRLDADYRTTGFEGRALNERDRPDDRVRRVHFANLPPRCTIRIFTLDGDLVREIDHDIDPSDPLANHDTWDLITRNTQLVVSGLYYWSVESPDGKTQIGKLVLLM